MKRHLFLAPDADTSTVGGDLAIPVIPPSAPPPSVTDVILGDNPPVETSSAVKAIEKPAAPKTKGPEDFGMESPDQSAERAGLKEGRERGPDGKFLKKGESSATPQPKAVVKPAATKPATPAKPVVAAAPSPAPVAKVKIGDQEKTAEEWAKELADLKTKAETATPAPKEPVVIAPVETDEQKAAAQKAQKEREDKFIETISAQYELDPANGGEYDQLLAGGPVGAKKFATMLARAEMKGRQFAADQVNKLADDFNAALGPILNQHETVQTLMADNAFLTAHPDIKSNPKGLETYQNVKKQMTDGYEAIQAKIKAGTASKSEQGWALQYEDMSKEQLQNDIAEHTLAILAKQPAPTPAVVKPTSPPKLTVVERPLGGDRPGAAAAPQTESAERRLAREVNASKGIHVA
jgi:hypothetical protein